METFYYVERLRNSENGIDVYLRDKNHEGLIVKDVHNNVVRCTVGENDMEYLLRTKNLESFCKISENELQDFIKHRVR